jgi:hypothetical protein
MADSTTAPPPSFPASSPLLSAEQVASQQKQARHHIPPPRDATATFVRNSLFNLGISGLMLLILVATLVIASVALAQLYSMGNQVNTFAPFINQLQADGFTPTQLSQILTAIGQQLRR